MNLVLTTLVMPKIANSFHGHVKILGFLGSANSARKLVMNVKKYETFPHDRSLSKQRMIIINA